MAHSSESFVLHEAFQTMKTASATIKGFEVMRMIRRGHCLTCKPHVKDEVRFVNKLLDVYSSAA